MGSREVAVVGELQDDLFPHHWVWLGGGGGGGGGGGDRSATGDP